MAWLRLLWRRVTNLRDPSFLTCSVSFNPPLFMGPIMHSVWMRAKPFKNPRVGSTTVTALNGRLKFNLAISRRKRHLFKKGHSDQFGLCSGTVLGHLWANTEELLAKIGLWWWWGGGGGELKCSNDSATLLDDKPTARTMVVGTFEVHSWTVWLCLCVCHVCCLEAFEFKLIPLFPFGHLGGNYVRNLGQRMLAWFYQRGT